MPASKRLSVLGIFALGGLYVTYASVFENFPITEITTSSVCIAGIIRIYALSKMFQSEDLTWNFSQGAIWSSVEPNIGIVCACLPTLYPLVRRWVPTWVLGSSVTPSSQQHHAPRSKLRSQTGEFYALKSHNMNNKSDDEMGLTNDFRGGGGHPPSHYGDDSASTDNRMNIIVKHDVVMTESSAM